MGNVSYSCREFMEEMKDKLLWNEIFQIFSHVYNLKSRSGEKLLWGSCAGQSWCPAGRREGCARRARAGQPAAPVWPLCGTALAAGAPRHGRHRGLEITPGKTPDGSYLRVTCSNSISLRNHHFLLLLNYWKRD